jgi:hypothetical protein
MAGVIRLTPAAAMVVLAGDVTGDGWVVAGVADGESRESAGCSKFEKSLGGDGCGM